MFSLEADSVGYYIASLVMGGILGSSVFLNSQNSLYGILSALLMFAVLASIKQIK